MGRLSERVSDAPMARISKDSDQLSDTLAVRLASFVHSLATCCVIACLFCNHTHVVADDPVRAFSA